MHTYTLIHKLSPSMSLYLLAYPPFLFLSLSLSSIVQVVAILSRPYRNSTSNWLTLSCGKERLHILCKWLPFSWLLPAHYSTQKYNGLACLNVSLWNCNLSELKIRQLSLTACYLFVKQITPVYSTGIWLQGESILSSSSETKPFSPLWLSDRVEMNYL